MPVGLSAMSNTMERKRDACRTERNKSIMTKIRIGTFHATLPPLLLLMQQAALCRLDLCACLTGTHLAFLC
eukprot:1151094-Pelagomonas_calceolata.AAC.6